MPITGLRPPPGVTSRASYASLVDSSNHWYGHAHLLARWCGLDESNPPPIDGPVQHGWTFTHGFGAPHKPPIGRTRFVWSDVCRRRGCAIGWRDYVVIGAPFAYLNEMEPAAAQERSGTIWYPFHGTVDYEQLSGDHGRLIEEIKEAEGDEVTVCLYHAEFEQPAIRAIYEAAGFRVICHGLRGTLWKNTEPRFLYKQLAELRRHKRVASNRLSTAVLYGLLAGCEAGVYGDPMALPDVAPGFDGEPLLHAWWPFMFGHQIDRELGAAFAREQLGADLLIPPQELSLLLGWDDEWRR